MITHRPAVTSLSDALTSSPSSAAPDFSGSQGRVTSWCTSVGKGT